MSERTSSAGAPVGAEAPPEVPARWSAARKTDVVLRLLRGAPEAREVRRLQAKLGEVLMRLELAEDPLDKRGVRGRVVEAWAMSAERSPAIGRRYPFTEVSGSIACPARRDLGAETREVSDGLNINLDADGSVLGFD